MKPIVKFPNKLAYDISSLFMLTDIATYKVVTYPGEEVRQGDLALVDACDHPPLLLPIPILDCDCYAIHVFTTVHFCMFISFGAS